MRNCNLYSNKQGEIIRVQLEGDANMIPIAAVDVMQFTGLTDKNGTEIYDGDIVKENEGRTIGIIMFVNGSFVSRNEHGRDLIPVLFLPKDMAGMENTNTNWYEVIGNIYENKEILREYKAKQAELTG